MIGRTLGHYRIIEKIGAGGMGEVYRARDEQLDRDVALKLLPPGMLRDEKARRRFRNEALLLAKLNHPNIATVHEFDTEGGADFLVMECVAGTSLAQKLETGPLPEKELLLIATQVAQALEEAHERGIVHRDLKPGNIVIAPKDRAKVLDFGIAKLLRPAGDTDPTQSITGSYGGGTLPYMSPEQLRGEAAGARSDIFSFGAVLYEMATGRRPCEETLPSRLIDAIVREHPVPPRLLNPKISSELERIILKCLEKEPENRYQSAKELEVDLRRLQMPSSAPVALAATVKPSPRSRVVEFAAIAMGVALLIALGLGVRTWRERQAAARANSTQIRSLAVLPLENLSGDPQQEYFAQGMTEELTTQLAQISALRVISRTSVTSYKDSRLSLPEIGKQLHVDALVEGSVMRSKDRVRITARLVRASNGDLLWAQSYERNVEDVLNLQDEVARTIASEVKVTLTPDEKARLANARPVNPAAHEAYLEGNALNKGTPAQQWIAKESFEEAIRIDPNYAPAYAGLAEYYWSNSQLDPSVAMPKAKKYALRALELDPNLAQAHTTLGAIRFYADWDWAGAEQELRHALELSPSDAEAHRTYSYFLAAMGRTDQAIAEIQRAQQIDPLNIWTQTTAGWVYYYSRQYDKAIAQCQNLLKLDPNAAGAYDCLGTSYLATGQYEKAIAAAQKASGFSNADPTRVVGLGRAYALAGKKADARRVIEQLRQLSAHTYVSPYFFATIYAALGQKDEAFNWLDKAFHQHDRYLAWLKVDAAIDPLRSDARLTRLLRQVGLIN